MQVLFKIIKSVKFSPKQEAMLHDMKEQDGSSTVILDCGRSAELDGQCVQRPWTAFFKITRLPRSCGKQQYNRLLTLRSRQEFKVSTAKCRP